VSERTFFVVTASVTRARAESAADAVRQVTALHPHGAAAIAGRDVVVASRKDADQLLAALAPSRGSRFVVVGPK
jgi:hypothetical protein